MDKQIYTALGFMSGTSLDGVDAAILRTDGVDITGFGPSTERSLSAAEKSQLQSVTRQALKWGFRGAAPNAFASAEAIIDQLHIETVRDMPAADIVGYHGQTILHHPPMNGQTGKTLQLGNGHTLASALGIPVAYDFRGADVAAGGQGAPLAPIYHEALCRYSKLAGSVAVVNIGGVSNITAIRDGQLVFATDCGPGNGPLDSWCESQSGLGYDKGGVASLSGRANFNIIEQWLNRDFFKRKIPRSADRYDFDVLDDLHGYSFEDGAATLASFCAQSVAADINRFTPDAVVLCGGGRRNLAIVRMLQSHVNGQVVSAEHVGWDGDMLEAQAFAYLAVRTLKGLPISFPETTAVATPMIGGHMAYP